MAPDIIERLQASAQHRLHIALLPFTHASFATSESNKHVMYY